MAATPKPTPPRPSPAPTGASSLFGASADAVRDSLLTRRPYFKFAFANAYNLSLFLGTLAAAAVTLNPLLALAAVGGEAIWLLHAPGSKRLRHLLWDPKFEAMRKAMEAEAREARLKGLGQEERARVQQLIVRQEDIHRLAERNPSFTAELLRTELVKTDRLVDAFIDMAVTCGRYEDYLEAVDFDALEQDRLRWEYVVRNGAPEEPHVDIAKKNLEVILRRIEKMKEIRRYLSVARGQLDLIENSFQLIADQIVTMQSPQQLSGQLDELLDGVETIRETTADTERMLSSLGITS